MYFLLGKERKADLRLVCFLIFKAVFKGVSKGIFNGTLVFIVLGTPRDSKKLCFLLQAPVRVVEGIRWSAYRAMVCQ